MGGVSKKCALRSRKTCRFGNQKCAFRHNKRRALDLWRGRRIAQSRLHTFDEMGRKKATALNDTLDVANMIFVKTKRATNTTRRFTDTPRNCLGRDTRSPTLWACNRPVPMNRSLRVSPRRSEQTFCGVLFCAITRWSATCVRRRACSKYEEGVVIVLQKRGANIPLLYC